MYSIFNMKSQIKCFTYTLDEQYVTSIWERAYRRLGKRLDKPKPSASFRRIKKRQLEATASLSSKDSDFCLVILQSAEKDSDGRFYSCLARLCVKKKQTKKTTVI